MFVIVCSSVVCQEQDEKSVDSSAVKTPGKALLFSMIPGGGQIYNQRPVKAALFAGAFIYYGLEYVKADDSYQMNLSDEELHRARNDKIWMMSLTWTLNILDAYVDAQLWDFQQYDIEEGDLPETEIIKPKETEETDDKD